MKQKFVLWIGALLVMTTVIFSPIISRQQVLAILLDKSATSQSNAEGLLTDENKTDTGQPNQLGNNVVDNNRLGDSVDTTTSDIANQQKAGPIIQGIKDSELVDRLFPLILQKIDGATIMQKVGPQDLLLKLEQVNQREFFEKVILPHLQAQLTGESKYAAREGYSNGRAIVAVQTPSCTDLSVDPKDRKYATGGGGQIDVDLTGAKGPITAGLPDDKFVGSRPGDFPGTWKVQAITSGDRVTAYVNCHGIKLSYVD
jgi:hypothetical protein